jgi:hypothetical protein
VAKRRWLIGGVIVAVLSLLGAYALFQREDPVKRNAHEELLRADVSASPVSCIEAPVSYGTPLFQITSYRCTTADGVRVADVQVKQPAGRTTFKGKRLSVMLAEESR